MNDPISYADDDEDVFECEYCEANFTVEADVEEEVAFCPFCGSDIYDDEGDEEE